MGNEDILLRVTGQVARPLALTFEDLEQIADSWQVEDVSQLVPGRIGSAVRLEGILALAGALPDARYLGLHAGADDFHASVPLESVRRQALLLYRLGNQPLPAAKGGPVRFLVPDPAACHTAEVDECASVKFLDHLELTHEKGRDTRPADQQAHEELHASEHP